MMKQGSERPGLVSFMPEFPFPIKCSSGLINTQRVTSVGTSTKWVCPNWFLYCQSSHVKPAAPHHSFWRVDRLEHPPGGPMFKGTNKLPIGRQHALRAYESCVIDLHHWKIVLRCWKLCKVVIIYGLLHVSSSGTRWLLRIHMMVVEWRWVRWCQNHHIGRQHALQAYESRVIDLHHWKVALRCWKLCKYITMLNFSWLFQWHRTIVEDSYDGSEGELDGANNHHSKHSSYIILLNKHVF